ncbi:hypothetical protein ACIQXV_06935 [Neobacillus sp. NPDC097160]|uniref:hypothetical protein n=1 Tax=Neobacillus sp. NPDC097160 TaxID=3364298 RepID=UPI003822B6D4
MKKIRCLSELLELKQKIQKDFGEYLEEEFYGLYEYLSNGEKVDEFVLAPYQAMILLEGKEELNKLLSNPLELEFREEVNLKDSMVLRIGILSAEDVQLCYKIK